MKKRVIFLLPLFWGACSESGDSPVITIEKLFVETRQEDNAEEDANVAGDEKENYANRMDELPALQVGDQVEAFLSLDGNGSELKTFKLQKDDEVVANLEYDRNEVSTEGNLTDEQNGQLRFKDGVSNTKVLVKATVDHVDKNGNVKLVFYLSSKAECGGAQTVIDLKTKKED